jgi:hypothetical protein
MERKPGPHDLLVALLLVQSLLERRSEVFFQPFVFPIVKEVNTVERERTCCAKLLF